MKFPITIECGLSMMNQKNLFYIKLIVFLSLSVLSYGDSALAAEDQYQKTLSAYQRFLENPEKIKYRDKWMFYVDKFHTIYSKNPSGKNAAAAMYITGEIYQKLYKLSYKPSDKREAAAIFERVIKTFPRGDYRKKAENALKALSGSSPPKPDKTAIPAKNKEQILKELKSKIALSKKTVKASSESETTAETGRSSARQKTVVQGIRFWSNPSYTRIVIDLDNDANYRHKLMGDEVSSDKPLQLYIDFDNSMLSDKLKGVIPINDDLLTDARPSQFTPDSVRVIIDIKSFKTYKIFSLKSPFKTIIDVWGKDARETAPPNVVKAPESDPPKPERSDFRSSKKMINDLAKQLALGVRRIVIDPGHGGKDVGAVGYYKSVYEKNITLAIAKKLAQKIRTRLGCEVFLTRTADRGMSLEERTAIANAKNADLFISIHTNSTQNHNAYGIETYFLNLATDDDAILVAARENATSRKNISDLQTILHDLMQNSKINESGKLAGYVQQSVYRQLGARYIAVKNKGVKQAPFYVLMGAQMPSILIETSFISNKRECERLNNPAYQDWLCEGIVQGIQRYIRETNPTAFMNQDTDNKDLSPETDDHAGS